MKARQHEVVGSRFVKITCVRLTAVDRHGVRFIGKATQQFDGTWRCLAAVGNALCIVEATVTQVCE